MAKKKLPSHATTDQGARTEQKLDGGWGWVVVISAFITNVICDGFRYSYGLLYIEFLHEFQRGKSETSWTGGLMLGVANLSGPMVSILVNRCGSRFAIILGSLLAFAANLISVFATSVFYLYISYGVIGGFGYCLMILPLKFVIIDYFDRRKTLAMGISLCGSGVGTIILNPLSKFLIDEYTWRGALMIESAIFLNVIICGWAMFPVEHCAIPLATRRINGMYSKVTANKIHRNIATDITDQEQNELLAVVLPTKSMKSLENSNDFIDKYCEGDHAPESAIGTNEAKCDTEVNISKLELNEAERDTEIINVDASASKSDEYTSMIVDQSGGSQESVTNQCDTYTHNTRHKTVKLLNTALLRDGGFLVFMLSFFLLLLSYMVPYAYLPDMAVAAGHSRADAALLMSAIGTANTACWLGGGVIGDRKWFNRWRVYIAAIFVAGASMVVMPLTLHYFYVLMAAAIVYGLCYGMVILSYSLVVAEVFGEENLTNALGIVLMGGGVAALIGQPFSGWIVDCTGSYLLSFVLAGSVFASGGLVLFLVPRLHTTVPPM